MSMIKGNAKKDEFIRTRIEAELKHEVEDIFKFIGLTPSQAIQMFYQQVKLNKGIPFQLKLPDETVLAIHDIEYETNLSKKLTKKELLKELGI